MNQKKDLSRKKIVPRVQCHGHGQFPLRTLNMKDNAKCIKRQDEDEVTETKS